MATHTETRLVVEATALKSLGGVRPFRALGLADFFRWDLSDLFFVSLASFPDRNMTTGFGVFCFVDFGVRVCSCTFFAWTVDSARITRSPFSRSEGSLRLVRSRMDDWAGR